MIKNPCYRIYETPNKVIAVSSFAGQTVRGVAKCNPADEFDAEKGAALAAARCGLKIAQKRTKRAYAKVDEAKISEFVEKNVDLRPSAIIEKFGLRRPIYRQLASYGHMGREETGVLWEKTDKADAIKKYLGI